MATAYRIAAALLDDLWLRTRIDWKGHVVNALYGKVVAITGGATGLGYAYADLAASEGAKVVLADIDGDAARTAAERLESCGAIAVPYVVDVSSWSEAHALVDFCVSTFGALHGLVNNAAIYYRARPEEETEARLRRLIEVNVLGAAYCGYAALRQMKAQGCGSLVNVVSGAQSGIETLSVYGASKGALASMTYGWAMEMARSNVRVNAVAPFGASQMTEITKRYFQERDTPHQGSTYPAANNAPLVVYLLSDRAAGVNGQVVRVQGEKMNLMTHPAVLLPGVEREVWTVDEVASVFDEQLFSQQLPLGVSGYEVSLGPYAVPYAADPLSHQLARDVPSSVTGG